MFAVSAACSFFAAVHAIFSSAALIRAGMRPYRYEPSRRWSACTIRNKSSASFSSMLSTSRLAWASAASYSSARCLFLALSLCISGMLMSASSLA